MKKQKFKNGDKVVFTESPFLGGVGGSLVYDTPVEIVNLEGDYFNFAIPDCPDEPIFTGCLSWVKKFEE